MVKTLKSIRLKTRIITFDDKLKQVRLIHLQNNQPKGIKFYDYDSLKGQMYLKKYHRYQKSYY